MSATRSRRLEVLPRAAHMTQAEAKLLLKEQVFKDATDAGWLRPCARKPGGGSVYYATNAVMDVSLRIAGGEYPAARGMPNAEYRMPNDGRRSA